jgi:uncharacterized protein (DUF2336 family)
MSSRSAALPADNLLDELQETLTHGTVAKRVEALRKVTDLFVNGAMDYSDEQVGLFDDVFQCLIVHLEISARALLSSSLAPIDKAPPRTIRTLAFDDAIEVAGPVLSQSARLDDDALIELARCKSQAHLLAISSRKSLSDAVTDVLVLRGNDEVVQSTVNNPGAEISERGFTRLVNRAAEGDDNLATCLGLRPSLPRHLYLKLLARASATVRARLEAAIPSRRPRCRSRCARRRAVCALGTVGDVEADRDCARAGQIAPRGRPAGRTSGHPVCRGRQVRRDQCRGLCTRQRAAGDRRKHDGGGSLRGHHDPRQDLGHVVVDGARDHRHA